MAENISLHLLQEENASLHKRIKELNKIQQVFTSINENDQDDKIMYQHKMNNMRDDFQGQIKTLNGKISILKKDLGQVQESYSEETRKYNQLRVQKKMIQQENQGLKLELDEVKQQIAKVEGHFMSREQEILQKYNESLEKQTKKYETILMKYQQENEKINKKYAILERKYDLTSKETVKLKELLEMQIGKRRTSENQARQEIEKLSNEISKLKEQQKQYKNLILEKNEEISKKDAQMISLERSIRQMNNRAKNIEEKARKQILREKSQTKKALDGLQMMKKYSEHELSKSRKKEKHFRDNQKELMMKIKEVEGRTSTKSSRKNSMKSFKSINTTLKDGESPSVSNFVLEDDNVSSLKLNDGCCNDTPSFEVTEQKMKTLRMFKGRKSGNH